MWPLHNGLAILLPTEALRDGMEEKKNKQAAGLHSSFAPFPPFALLLSLMFPWLICPPLPTVSLVHFVVLRHEQDADHSAKGKSVIQGKVR